MVYVVIGLGLACLCILIYDASGRAGGAGR